MWDANFPKLLPRNYLSANLPLKLPQSSDPCGLLHDRRSTFDVDFSEFCGSVKFITTVVAGILQDRHILICGLILHRSFSAKIVKAENLWVAPIDHEIDQ